MKRREDNNLPIEALYLLVELVNLASLLEVLISEQEVTDQQFLHCLHLNAANHLLLPIGDLILMILHHIIELLKHPGLTHSFGILHPGDHRRILEHLVETIKISVRALGEHYLLYPLHLYLIIILFYLSLYVPEKLVIQEARTGDNQALDPREVQRGNSVVALLEELHQ